MGGTPAQAMRIIDEELEDLRGFVCAIGGRVEAVIAGSIAAIVSGDEERAALIAGECRQIDGMDFELDHKATRLIALRNPMADDLRVVVLAIKIAAILSRMAAGARNIAERVPEVRARRGSEELRMLSAMGEMVVEMVRVSLDGFARGDSSFAPALARQDRMVDGYYGCLLKNLLAVMSADAREIGSATHLLFVAKTLERIGDNAAKIGRSLDLAAPSEPQAA